MTWHGNTHWNEVTVRMCLVFVGWEGAGLGRSEQGIQNPISGGEVRDKFDQFKVRTTFSFILAFVILGVLVFFTFSSVHSRLLPLYNQAFFAVLPHPFYSYLYLFSPFSIMWKHLILPQPVQPILRPLTGSLNCLGTRL